MKAIIIGSSGTIGKAVTQLFKSKGYDVTEASRSTKPSIDIDAPQSIDQFFKGVDETDVIICAAGSAAMAPVDKLSDAKIDLSVRSKLVGQINVARKGLMHLKPNGVIVLTGGMLAYAPAPQTAMITMVNAGLEGFVKAAALDLTEGRRIVIVHPPWVAETAAKLGMDASPWPNASKTAGAYLAAVQSSVNGAAFFVEGYRP